LKKIIIIALAFFALLAACSDTLQETLYEKDVEAGKYDASKFDKARFQ
jgi:hypothetical protein